MKNLTYIFIGLFFLNPLSAFGYDYDGVLSTKPSQALDGHRHKRLRSQIESYVQQMMISFTIKTVSDTIDRATKNSPARLMPDIGYLAAQQGALQCYRQDSTLSIIRQVYNDTVDLAVQDLESGTDPNQVQGTIKELIELGLAELVNDYTFRQIVEKVVQNAVMNQQMLIQQQAIEQGLKNMAVQQQQVQQALKEEYTKSVSSVLVK